MDSEDVKEAVEDGVGLESGSAGKASNAVPKILADLKSTLQSGDLSRYGIYKLVKDTVRLVTGGYWLGPRMEPAIRILKKVKDPVA
jgi:alpha-1,6-mannosyltransferase